MLPLLLPMRRRRWITGMIAPSRRARHGQQHVAKREPYGFRVGGKTQAHPAQPVCRRERHCSKTDQATRDAGVLSRRAASDTQSCSEIADTNTPDGAARRWAPWLCAYSGARVGEITQLRGIDVIERDGTHALRITPEAGTVKSRKPRVVPLHEHLIEQGFLEFAANHGDGPLFYTPRKSKKPPYAQARQRLAEWVRSLGISTRSCSQTTRGGTHSNKLPTMQESLSARPTTSRGTHKERRSDIWSPDAAADGGRVEEVSAIRTRGSTS